MSLFKDFIETVGLDHTFFYQLIIITLLYFVVKKLFLLRYYQDVEKRRERTKGSFSKSKEVEEKIVNLEKKYSQKAQTLNQKFQDVFGRIKEESEKSFQKNKLILEEEQRKRLESQRSQILKDKNQEEQKLEKDMPHLVQSLVDKMVGKT